MAKLYAELTSDKGGRVVGKGGNHHLAIKITKDNKQIGYIDVLPSGNIICEAFEDGDIVIVDDIKA